jgi:chlorophyll synthase
MEQHAATPPSVSAPKPAALLELLKPITWFAPMWAFGCGVISSGQPILENWLAVLAGILLAGPFVCGTSQVVNDWFDRHVDAINEPGRPIPSGRVPGHWGLGFALVWTAASIALAATLGLWVFVAALIGMAFAWAYSAPPFRLKRDGWLGPGAVGLCYEGLPWFTGAAAMATAFPSLQVVSLAVLYSLGAHGIMTLNDFKAVEGDRQTGLRSLPVTLGVDRAAKLSCVVMAVPQVIVVALLVAWDAPGFAAAVGGLLLAQFLLMRRLLSDPAKHAPWYNATGTSLYVLGMLVSAIALNLSADAAAWPSLT